MCPNHSLLQDTVSSHHKDTFQLLFFYNMFLLSMRNTFKKLCPSPLKCCARARLDADRSDGTDALLYYHCYETTYTKITWLQIDETRGTFCHFKVNIIQKVSGVKFFFNTGFEAHRKIKRLNYKHLPPPRKKRDVI